MQLNILLFGACREAVGQAEIACEIAAPATVASVWAVLKTQHPVLAGFENHALFAVNEEHARLTHPIHPGDVLAVFPPVSGG
jgi:molybdopterin converting factor subunit 1